MNVHTHAQTHAQLSGWKQGPDLWYAQTEDTLEEKYLTNAFVFLSMLSTKQVIVSTGLSSVISHFNPLLCPQVNFPYNV